MEHLTNESNMRSKILRWTCQKNFSPIIIGSNGFTSDLFYLFQKKLLQEGIYLRDPSLCQNDYDLMIIVGRVNYKLLAKIQQIYSELKRDRHVICIQNTATVSHHEWEYNVVHDLSGHISVNYYLQGVPPTYEAFRDAILSLSEKKL